MKGKKLKKCDIFNCRNENGKNVDGDQNGLEENSFNEERKRWLGAGGVSGTPFVGELGFGV